MVWLILKDLYKGLNELIQVNILLFISKMVKLKNIEKLSV